MRIGRYASLLLATALIVAFVAADVMARPQPNHYELEKWRAGAAGGCSPCTGLCDPQAGDAG